VSGDAGGARREGGRGGRRAPPPVSYAGGPGPVLDRAFDRSSLDALRAAVAAHAYLAGAAAAEVGDFVLVVHELAANAVLHGGGHGRLRAWRHGQALHCEVTDDGPPPGPGGVRWPVRSAPPPGPAWWPAEHGHGLWVVSQLADQTSLRCEPGSTRACARLPLPAAGA
jgi:anti-sigma regulatory factor (Ser/Thr protein kinase)